MEIIFMKPHISCLQCHSLQCTLLAHATCGDIIADKLVERLCVVKGFYIYKEFRDL